MAQQKPLYTVSGEKELRKTMKQAGEDLADLKDAHQRVGNLVVDVAKPMAPRVSSALSGTIRAARMAGGVSIKAGGSSVPYAGPIHWGWPARNIEAQPFLSDAATSSETTWVGLYEEELNKIIDRIEGDT